MNCSMFIKKKKHLIMLFWLYMLLMTLNGKFIYKVDFCFAIQICNGYEGKLKKCRKQKQYSHWGVLMSNFLKEKLC